MSWETYRRNFLALSILLNRGKISGEAARVVEWLKSNEDIMQNVKIVEDVSFAPNILVISEKKNVRESINLFLNLAKNKEILKIVTEGREPNSQELQSVVREMGQKGLYTPREIINALKKNHSGDIYIQIEMNANELVPNEIKNSYVQNPWLLYYNETIQKLKVKVETAKEDKKDTPMDESFSNKVDVAWALNEIDSALERRDFDKCKELRQYLKDKGWNN